MKSPKCCVILAHYHQCALDVILQKKRHIYFFDQKKLLYIHIDMYVGMGVYL